jgi:hypothetical protein
MIELEDQELECEIESLTSLSYEGTRGLREDTASEERGG